jgi:AMIN domain
MKVLGQLGCLLLAVSCAAAQGVPASLQGVKVRRTDKGIQVDVSLTGSVEPSVITTTKPDRLVLDLPNTVADAKQQRMNVSADGVRMVRFGLHAATPPVTRVVIDLDSSHTYELRHNGTLIGLTVVRTGAEKASVHRVPPGAARGGFLLVFSRGRPNQRPSNADEALKRPLPDVRPGPTSGVSWEPPASNAPPPARAGLQQGIVFPGDGAPETGVVPKVAEHSKQSAATGPSTASVAAGGAGNSTSSPGSATANSATAAQTATTAAGTGVRPGIAPATTTTSATTYGQAVTAGATAPVGAPGDQSTPSAAATATQTTSAQGEATAPSVPVASTSNAPPTPTTATNAASSSQAAAPAVNTPVAAPGPPQPPAAAPQAIAEAQATSSVNTVATAASPSVPDSDSAHPREAASAPSDTGPGATTASEPGAPTADINDQDVAALPAVDPNLKTVFKVKYVANGVVYLDGGRSSGLAEGMKLEVKDTDLPVKQGVAANPADPRVAAELEVTAVAETSAVTDIHAAKRPVKEGDLAYLSDTDTQTLIQQRTLSPTRDYPMVIAFTEGEPLDEEVRKEVPRPPMPSVNRARGRIGFDYMGTVSHGVPSSTNTDVGMVLRADITRIHGSYWNLTGYWRGRLHQQSAATQATLQDLINRTYHLGMFYDNPNSRWVAGVGRMYLPWAPSLDTIDGGYFGTKLGHGATAGIFAGSTPDPTSWSYNPDRRLGGTFINFEGGSYDDFHYTSTSGVGISTLKWQIDRPFVFFENTLSYKRFFSIYDSLQADSPQANPAVPAPGPGLSRNFLTMRVQVHPRVELDFNHSYLRDVPTYDPALVGTGLLDKYLFQGFSGGARVEVLKQVFVYTNLGSSNRSGDAKNSLNQLYGLTFARLPWWGLRADLHYSRFNSSFADGKYRAFSVGRNLSDALRLDILVGDQTYTSALATSDRTRFINANMETSFGRRYFMQGGFTINRGQTQNYDQWLMTLGYRFDSRKSW